MPRLIAPVQTPAVKAAWARRTQDRDMFDFSVRSPAVQPLIDFVERSLPDRAQVVILGGGVCSIVPCLQPKERCFVNVELGDVPSSRVACGVSNHRVLTVTGDMEHAIPIARQPGFPHAVFTPFSIEYTSIATSTGVVSDYLLEGERFVTLSHHADSPIVVTHKAILRFFEAAVKVVSRVERGEPANLDAVDAVLRDRTNMLQTIDEAFYEFAMRMRRMLDFFSRGIPIPFCENLGRDLREMREMQHGFTAPFVHQEFRTPREFASLADERLKLVDGMVHGEGNINVVVCAAFEKQ